MNARGTWDNIQLIITCIVLLHNNFISPEEIKVGLDAYLQSCRSGTDAYHICSQQYLELKFETVMLTLRLMGKAMSEIIFDAWCKHMERYLVCYQKDRILLEREVSEAQKEFERLKNLMIRPHDNVVKSSHKRLKHSSTDKFSSSTRKSKFYLSSPGKPQINSSATKAR